MIVFKVLIQVYIIKSALYAAAVYSQEMIKRNRLLIVPKEAPDLIESLEAF